MEDLVMRPGSAADSRSPDPGTSPQQRPDFGKTLYESGEIPQQRPDSGNVPSGTGEAPTLRDLAGFYRGKTVFLTGGTGFKGSWLCLLLRELGATVADYSLDPPSAPSLWNLADIGSSVRSLRGDITDRDTLKTAMRRAEPAIVFHLAAQALVRPSYADPWGTFQANIMGTAALLEAVRACPSVRACVVVTSDKCYENTGGPYVYTESDPMGGHDPYAASKGCAELIVAACRRSFFADGETGLASARAGNVIGGGDFAAERLIPDAVRAFCAGGKIVLRNPHAVRPWQYVLEPLRGYLMLAARLYASPHGFAEGWNFGPPDNVHTVGEVLSLFARQWGASAAYVPAQGAQPHEAAFLGLDCAKAAGRLGWKPVLNFRECVAWTAEWYRAWHDGNDARDLCLAQIHRFLEV